MKSGMVDSFRFFLFEAVLYFNAYRFLSKEKANLPLMANWLFGSDPNGIRTRTATLKGW